MAYNNFEIHSIGVIDLFARVFFFFSFPSSSLSDELLKVRCHKNALRRIKTLLLINYSFKSYCKVFLVSSQRIAILVSYFFWPSFFSQNGKSQHLPLLPDLSFCRKKKIYIYVHFSLSSFTKLRFKLTLLFVRQRNIFA